MATNGWRHVALAEILTEARERVPVEPQGVYPIAGVYGFGRGVLLRGQVRGTEISAPYLYRIATGQILYSRLKAFEGAFALVPPGADGRYVSNEFPSFNVDETRALPEFVALFLSVPATWAELAEGITGMGARRERLPVSAFLQFEVDLPPIDEQRRLVYAVGSWDDVVSTATIEAEAARTVAVAIHGELAGGPGWRRVRLGEVAALDLASVPV